MKTDKMRVRYMASSLCSPRVCRCLHEMRVAKKESLRTDPADSENGVKLLIALFVAADVAREVFCHVDVLFGKASGNKVAALAILPAADFERLFHVDAHCFRAFD